MRAYLRTTGNTATPPSWYMRAAEMSRPALPKSLWLAAQARWQAIILGAAILVGAGLRLVGLGRNSFWVDELYVIWEARQRLGVLFDPQIHVQHPPQASVSLYSFRVSNGSQRKLHGFAIG